MILDEKLTFGKHIKEAIEKAKISLGLMKYMSYINRKVIDQMYKMYVRPHLDYGDIIFHGQHQDTMKLLDSIQYQAGLIVTGCWKSTSAEKLYTELGWETLSERRICRRFYLYIYEIILRNFRFLKTVQSDTKTHFFRTVHFTGVNWMKQHVS